MKTLKQTAKSIAVLLVSLMMITFAQVTSPKLALAQKPTPPQLKYLDLYPNADYTAVHKFDRDDGYGYGIDFLSNDSKADIYHYFYKEVEKQGWDNDTYDQTFKEIRAYRGPISIWIGFEDNKTPGYACKVKMDYEEKTTYKPEDLHKPSTKKRTILAKPYPMPGIPDYPKASFLSGTYTEEKRPKCVRRSCGLQYKTDDSAQSVFDFFFNEMPKLGWNFRKYKKPQAPDFRKGEISSSTLANGACFTDDDRASSLDISIKTETGLKSKQDTTTYWLHYQSASKR